MATRNRNAVSDSLSERIDAQRSKLWEVSGILELAVASMRETDTPVGKPIVWTALNGAQSILDKAIEALEPAVLESSEDSSTAEVSHG